MAFNYGNDNYDLLWSGVSGEHEFAQKQASFVHSKVAVAQYWPFLSRAVDEGDFENRLSLTLDRIEARVQPGTLEDVLSSLRDDFRALAAKSDDDDDKDDDKKSDNPFGEKKEDESSDDDDESDDDSDDDDSDDKKSKDSDDDSDDDDKPAFLKGKKSAWYNKDDDDYDAERAAKWDEGARRLADAEKSVNNNRAGQGHSRDQDGRTQPHHATNYQPDPNADWRYHPGYEQLRAPVNNGDLQDSDGFVTDLAQGEGRSNPVIEERQLTPGTWTAHDGMPERPMPFSQQRGYQPVASGTHRLAEFTHRTITTQTPGAGESRLDPHVQYHESEDEARAYGDQRQGGGRDTIVESRGDGNTWGYAPHRPHGFTASFDSQGFLVEALVDPAPGTPQRHNPFYFQQGSNVGGNEGFPVNPGEEPKPNNLEEFYGEVPPVASSGESSEGTTDGQGYSRLSSLHYDAEGYFVESPNFI